MTTTHNNKLYDPKTQDLSFGRLISTNIAVKFQVDIINQIFNPFLTIIAAGLGVNVVTLGQLLSLRSLVGVCTPFIGALADRMGYRAMIRLCLLLTAMGSAFIGISTNFIMATIGLLLTGIGTAGFVPVIHAYSSAYLPYEKRARGMGIIEYSWALAGIIGLPIMGVAINWYGWRTPFFLLAAGLLVAWLIFGWMPEAKQQPEVEGEAAKSASYRSTSLQMLIKFFDLGNNARSAYCAIFAQGFTFFAAMQLTIAYGPWFTTEYQLTSVQLGQVALVVGCFDLIGSVSVSLFTDRIGKRLSVLIGNIGMLIGFILLPWLNIGIYSAVFSLAFIRGVFEFGIVSGFPLLSEQVEGQPGKVLSLGSTTVWIAGAVASLTGPWLYVNYGVNTICIISSVSVCFAILLLFVGVQDSVIERH